MEKITFQHSNNRVKVNRVSAQSGNRTRATAVRAWDPAARPPAGSNLFVTSCFYVWVHTTLYKQITATDTGLHQDNVMLWCLG